MAGGYEIYGYGNVDALSGVFNAIAAISGGDDFKSIIAAVLVIGFLFAFLAYALKPQNHQGLMWLVSVSLIYIILFVPKSSVQIVDKIGNQATVVVDNVPWGLAAQASVISSIGNTMTELFETAVQTIPPAGVSLDEELNYGKHGLMFGAKLVKNTRESVFGDPAFRMDMVNFLKNCTYYDVAQQFIKIEDLACEKDIWPKLSKTNPARFSYLSTSTPAEAKPCPDVYADLDSRMGAQTEHMLKNIALRSNAQLANYVKDNNFSEIEPSIIKAYTSTQIASAAANAADLVRQNGLINALYESDVLAAQRSGDTSSVIIGLTRAQSIAQLNAQQVSSGKLAEEALPMIRNNIEAVMYFCFPLVILVVLLFSGKTSMDLLKNYALTLLWLAMWPPLYAVVNYFSGLHYAKQAQSAAYVGGFCKAAGAEPTALTLTTADPLYSGTVSELALVGWLVVSVPILAAGVVFGMNKLSSMVSGLIGGAGAGVWGAAASGNVNVGNVSMDQQSISPTRNSPLILTTTDGFGTTTTRADGTFLAAQQRMSSMDVSLGTNESYGQTEKETSSRSLQSAEKKMQSAEESFARSKSEANVHGFSVATGTNEGSGFGKRESKDFGEGAETSSNRDHQYSDQVNVRTDSNARNELSAGASAGLPKTSAPGQKGSNIPSQSSAQATQSNLPAPAGSQSKDNIPNMAVGTPTKAGVSANVGFQGSLANLDSASANSGVNTTAGTRDSHKQTFSSLDSLIKSNEFQEFKRTNREAAHRIESSFNEGMQLRASAQRDFADAKLYQQAAEIASARGTQASSNYNNKLAQYIAERGGFDGSKSLEDRQQMVRDYVRSHANELVNSRDYRVIDHTPPTSLNSGSNSGLTAASTFSDNKPLSPPALPRSTLRGSDGGGMTHGEHGMTSHSSSPTMPTSNPTIPTSNSSTKSELQQQWEEQKSKVSTAQGAINSGIQKEITRTQEAFVKKTNEQPFLQSLNDNPQGTSGHQQVNKKAEEIKEILKQREDLERDLNKFGDKNQSGKDRKK